MRTVAVLLACAACGAKEEDDAVVSDSGSVSEPASPAQAGRSAPNDKPSGQPSATNGGSGSTSGSPTQSNAGAPAADSGPPVERATEFDAGDDPARNKIMAGQLCDRISTINCAGESFCCDSPGRTVEACKQDLFTTCMNDLMLDRISMFESSKFDAAQAEKVFTELERLASACDPAIAKWGGSTEGLRGIMRGSIEPAASCKPVAALPEVVEIGAALVSCKDPATYACVYASLLDAWTCEKRGEAGGNCVTDNNCVDGLYCVASTSAPGISAGTCTPRRQAGEPCTAPSECESLFCKKSLCAETSQQAAYCLVN
jgi:hypothetical protein